MLQLIFGTSGSGKSYKIKSIIKEKILEEKKKIMLIVPEQYSFENEREILKILGAKDCNKVEVMSFTRLTNLVFKRFGGRTGIRIDDALRNVLMSLAIEQSSENLLIYNDSTLSENLVGMMISALKELKMCSIKIDELFSVSKETDNEILKRKLNDTAMILSTYDALLSQNYIDPLDDLTWLSEAVFDNNFFEGYTVLIDSFSGFTIQELKVIEQILIQSNECYVSLCMDDIKNKKSELDLFAPVYKTADQIIRIAKKNSVKIKPHIKLLDMPRYKSNDLKVLAKSIYREKETENIKCEGDIFMFSASNLHSEAMFVSNTIKKLVVEDGYKYRDFAIISREGERYAGIIDSSLNKNNIPYFSDDARPIDAKPIIKFVTTAFEIIKSSFDSELIFKYLKTGITSIDTDSISNLENYVFMWDIKGNQWKEEFKANPNGFSEKLDESDEEFIKSLNETRMKVISPLLEFEKKIKGKNTGIEISRAIYELLKDNNVHENLLVIYKKLKEENNISIAREQLRLWDIFMDILDKIAAVLKDKYLTADRYLEILRLMIQSNDISFIPEGIDQVIVASADRVRLQSPKVVFLIGVVEGEFPKTPSSFGVFSDSERKALIEYGIDIQENIEQSAVKERFLAYLSISAASEKLYVSWPSSDIKGASKKPSSIIKEILKIIPGVEIMDEFSLSQYESDNIWSEDTAFELCARHFKDDSVISSTLKYYFKDNDQYKSKLESLEKISNGRMFKFKDPKKARELFGENLNLSASQVEKFYLCKFQYFCQYGLYAKPKKQAVFDNLEYGLVMHYLLENILKKYDKDSFCKISKEQAEDDIRELLNNYINTKLGGMENKNARFKYLFFRLLSTARKLILHIAEELSQSEFCPVGYEVEVAENGEVDPLLIKLPDGSSVKVRGKIDRVDVMEKGGKNYIRIVDYKTGKKEFRLSDILYGLNMQMLLYITAICKGSKYKNVVPAGILYMPSSTSSVSVEKNTKMEKIESEYMKNLRMNGLILDDPIVINGMEEEAKGVFIPVALKDGKPAKSESICSLVEMGKLSKYAESLIEQMAMELHSGNIEKTPISGEYDSCKWCNYSSVCGHEKNDKAFSIEKLSKKQVMSEIIEKEGELDGSKELDR